MSKDMRLGVPKGHTMKPSRQYRFLAADLRRRAKQDTDCNNRAEWETLANLYDRLAIQAEQNGRTGDLYDPILKPHRKHGSEAE